MSEKSCYLCKVVKPFTSFHKSKRAGDGLQGYCKVCLYAANRKGVQKYRQLAKEAAADRGRERESARDATLREAADYVYANPSISIIELLAKFKLSRMVFRRTHHLYTGVWGGEFRQRRLHLVRNAEPFSTRDVYEQEAIEHTSAKWARPDGMKLCAHCQVDKPVAEFYAEPRHPDGYRYNCGACDILRVNETRRKREMKYAAIIGTPVDPSTYKLGDVKISRAKKDAEAMAELLNQEHGTRLRRPSGWKKKKVPYTPQERRERAAAAHKERRAKILRDFVGPPRPKRYRSGPVKLVEPRLIKVREIPPRKGTIAMPATKFTSTFVGGTNPFASLRASTTPRVKEEEYA